MLVTVDKIREKLSQLVYGFYKGQYVYWYSNSYDVESKWIIKNFRGAFLECDLVDIRNQDGKHQTLLMDKFFKEYQFDRRDIYKEPKFKYGKK